MVGGRYRIEDVVGTGAMGTVWRGYDTRLRRPVAVKEVNLPPTATDDERTVLTRRAMAEARHAAKVSHPNIVAVHDVVADRGLPCLVMRLVEGRSLGDVVRASGPLDPVRVARIGVALVDALAAAHRGGVVHRDVKPSNVLLTDDGEVLLTDFSIATDAMRGTASAGGGALGSPGYIAPERLNGQSTGREADLFGLGATLFCAVEGYGPFDRPDPLAALLATATSPHPVPVRAGGLAPLLDALLVKDPAERPSLAQVRVGLDAVARGTDAPTGTLPGVAADAAPPEVPADEAATVAAATAAAPRPPTDSPSDPSRAASVQADDPRPGEGARSGAGASADAAARADAVPRADGRTGAVPRSGLPTPGVPQHAAPRRAGRRRAVIAALAATVCAALVLAFVVLRDGSGGTDAPVSSTASLAASLPVVSAAPGASASSASPPSSASASASGTPTPSASASSSKPPTPSRSPSPDPIGQVTTAELSVSPSSYLGSCANPVTFTVNLSVGVDDGPTVVRYTVSLAPGDSEVAGGAGTASDPDDPVEFSDQVGLEFTQGSRTYAVQAVVDSPTRFSPVPARISVLCVG